MGVRLSAAISPPKRMWRCASRNRIRVVSASVAPPSAPQVAGMTAVDVARSRNTAAKGRKCGNEHAKLELLARKGSHTRARTAISAKPKALIRRSLSA